MRIKVTCRQISGAGRHAQRVDTLETSDRQLAEAGHHGSVPQGPAVRNAADVNVLYLIALWYVCTHDDNGGLISILLDLTYFSLLYDTMTLDYVSDICF